MMDDLDQLDGILPSEVFSFENQVHALPLPTMDPPSANPHETQASVALSDDMIPDVKIEACGCCGVLERELLDWKISQANFHYNEIHSILTSIIPSMVSRIFLCSLFLPVSRVLGF
jgi:hypothetical protein